MSGPVLSVDGYTVAFPDAWLAGKFDSWVFYNQHFCRVQDGLKAVDIVAVSPDGVVYLIEFKDYRNRKREKTETLLSEFIGKTLSTLAALLPAGCNARDSDEQALARRALSSVRTKLILHLDQSKPGNKLFPPVADAAALTQKLRGRLRSIDTHPKVCNSGAMAGVPWTVR
jgi:hypothetical protein